MYFVLLRYNFILKKNVWKRIMFGYSSSYGIESFLLHLQVEQHLHQFCLTWQLHNKHLFHCIIYMDPVVQKCLPKAVENLRFMSFCDSVLYL